MTKSAKSTRYLSDIQERKIAEELRGKVVVNSGATPFRKGDVSLESVLIDGKTVAASQKSVSIKREWLRKIAGEAFIMRKPLSAIAIDFGDSDRYYVVSEGDFRSMYQAWVEVNHEDEVE